MEMRRTSELGRELARARWGSRSRTIDSSLDKIAARTALIEPDQAERLGRLAEIAAEHITTTEEDR